MGRRARAGRARPAAAAAAVSGCPPAPTTVSSPSGSASTHSSASTAASALASSSSVEPTPREPEVVGERADEDVLLLRHERDLAAQLVERAGRRVGRRRRRPGRSAAGGCPRAGGRASTCRRPTARRPRFARPGSRSRSSPCRTSRPSTVGVADVVRRAAGRRPAPRRSPSRSFGNLRDPDEPRERGRPDLDLVEPRDQAVDRVGELLDVERDGGHLADRRTSGRDEPPAPGERGRDGQDVGDLDGREPDRAQVERSPLGCVGVA